MNMQHCIPNRLVGTLVAAIALLAIPVFPAVAQAPQVPAPQASTSAPRRRPP